MPFLIVPVVDSALVLAPRRGRRRGDPVEALWLDRHLILQGPGIVQKVTTMENDLPRGWMWSEAFEMLARAERPASGNLQADPFGITAAGLGAAG